MSNNLRQKLKQIFKNLIVSTVLLTVAVFLLLFLAVKDQVQLLSPPATPIFVDRYGSFLSEGTGAETDALGFWEPPRSLPERIVMCLLAIEDKRFYEHPGVDVRSMLRAAVNNLTGRKRQGASTIAMQVARMQQPGNRRYWKKACETVTAVLLIRKFGHEEVLRQYFKLAPQGNRIHGFSYAARRYFRKPLQDVSWAEAAVLTSLPRAPGNMNLYRFDGRKVAFARARLILDLLHKEGKLDEAAYTISQRQLKRLTIPSKEQRPYHSYHAILRLEEAFKKERAYTRPISATLDLQIQEKIDQFADEAIMQYRRRGAGNVAVIVAEKATGAVRGYLGSSFYLDEVYAGAINYATTPRSAGSTLKPFIYALGLSEATFGPATVLSDLPFHISHPSGHYSVDNYDEDYLGPLLYRKALANSRNIPAVYVLRTVGLEKTYDLFRRLGLAKDGRPANYYGLGLAIGGLYVTLEELVTAYGVLANDGKTFSLRWFEQTDEDIPEQIIPQEVARQITLFLSDPLARLPSFSRMGPLEYPFPVAVKTGTSQGFRDAWSVAYSSKYIVGVWIGHPDNERMKDVGGLDAAWLVKQIMGVLHPTESRGVNETPFATPEGYMPVKLCSLSGELATEDCSEVVVEYFRPGTAPTTLNSVHQHFAVDKHTGALADTSTPPEQVEVRSYVVLPPKFAGWGAKRGYGKPPLPSGQSQQTSIAIEEPVDGAVFVCNPAVPKQLQTIPLRASVTPAVPKIVWYVDGSLFQETSYPYTARWQLSSGTHTVQARFPHANVESDVITVTISQ